MITLNPKVVYEGMVGDGDNFIYEKNRDLKTVGRSFLKLKESIIKHKGVISPIIIDITADGKFLVVDGQHRLEICRSLGLKIKYIFVPGSHEALISLNNDRKNWQIHDYVEFFSKEYPAYARLMQLKKQTNLSYNAIHALLKGKEIDSLTFKEGKFSVSQKEEQDFMKHFDRIKELSLTRDGANRPVLTKTRTINVLSKLINIKGYDHSGFKRKLEKKTMVSVNTNKEAESELLKIYNKGTPKAKRILTILGDD